MPTNFQSAVMILKVSYDCDFTLNTIADTSQYELFSLISHTNVSDWAQELQ